MIPVAKPYLTKKEAAAASRAILSGWVTQGPRVKAFEDAFAKYVNAKYACAISNCTAALHLALLAVGVKPGDCVVTVSHSFIATANSIRYCGADPVFVDIDPDTFNMSPGCLNEFLTKQCRRQSGKLTFKNKRVAAILTVHQMGMPCDLKSIAAIAKKFRLPLIEDAACAVGSEIKFGKSWERIGKPHGDIACFSFHPRKLLTTGEGGMLTASSKIYDRMFRLLRHQGMDVSDLKRHKSKNVIIEKYPIVGYNYRLTDIQAAIGIEQLKELPGILKRRRQLAALYRKELAGIPWLSTPVEPSFCRSNWQSYPVKVLRTAPRSRNRLMQYLLDHDVSTRAGIMNSHEEKPYRKKGSRLAHSTSARNSVVLLPLFFTMKNSDIKKICHLLKNA